jgi:hypothetical protein
VGCCHHERITGCIAGIALWLGLAAWCAHIAATKRRSGVAWFVLGLVFGLLALLIVACLSTDRLAYDVPRYRRVR